jgi:hypothetical protein
MLLAFLSLLLITGCGEKKIVITNFPSFYKGQIKVIAVAPFRNATGEKDVGNIISDAVAAQLAVNGTYKVYNRNDLGVLESERDLRTEMGLDNAKIAAAFRKAGKVQAVLVGTVNIYKTNQTQTPKQEPIYGMQPYYVGSQLMYRTVVTGYRRYTLIRNDANVVVTARLIRVADGAPIYATPNPIRGTYWAQGSPPPMDGYACLSNATTIAVNQLVRTFAVTSQQIEVKPSRDFRTASELYDNKWTYTDRFSAGATKGYIVLQLPAVCDRNRFRLTIVRKDVREDLHSEDIVWTKKYGSFGYTFSPLKVAQAGGGPGEYEAKFYSGPEPVMRHKFRIE